MASRSLAHEGMCFGFGPKKSGEDAFDALVGLLAMIEVVEGRRTERFEITSLLIPGENDSPAEI
jgi:hypothetical protein